MKSKLYKKTMRSIHTVYYIRKITQPIYLKIMAILMLVVVGMTQVSMLDVIKNMVAMDTQRIFTYSFSAFMQTEILVQGVLLAIAGLLVWAIIDIVHSHHNHHGHLGV